MLVYLTFLVLLFLVKRTPLFRFLSLLFAGSLLSGILTAQPLGLFDLQSNVNALFSVLIIFMCFEGFNVKPSLASVKFDLRNKNHKLIKAVIFTSCIAVVVNLYVVLTSLNHMLAAGLIVSEFKNSGYGEDFIARNFNFLISSFSFIISPLSYLSLAAHFYFLVIENRKMTFWALIGSLNIAIVPLIYFARGGLATFILLYLSMLIFVYTYLSAEVKKKVKSNILLALAPIFIVFLIISNNRFESYHYFNDKSVISNPVIYSTFDYFSQWLVNGDYLLTKFDISKLTNGSNFTYIPKKLLSPFDVNFAELQDLRELHFGGRENYFNGLPALLLYDFGYFISTFIAVLFMLFVRFRLKKKEGILIKLFWLSVMLPIPLFFFQGLFTVFGFYNLAILYVVFISIIMRLRIKGGA